MAGDPYGGAGPYGANRFITDQPMGGMGASGLQPWDYQVPTPQMPVDQGYTGQPVTPPGGFGGLMGDVMNYTREQRRGLLAQQLKGGTWQPGMFANFPRLGREGGPR